MSLARNTLQAAIEYWITTKQRIESSVPFHHDWIHVAAGVTIYFALVLIVRRPRSRLIAWMTVLLLELLNEAIDIAAVHRSTIYFESAMDLLATMALPTLALLITAIRRRKTRAPANVQG